MTTGGKKHKSSLWVNTLGFKCNRYECQNKDITVAIG